MPGLKIAVPAKVNLHLKVGNRRRDGFHTVRTVLHTVGLWDEIRVTAAPSFRFIASGHPVPRGDGNLCVRAYRMLRGRADLRSPVCLHLVKRIPPAAGLGGGSADAAACLKGLAEFWRLKLRRDELARLARHLGSDVPFFLKGRAAVGTGRGDRLRSVPSRIDCWLVILKPGYPGHTRAAYRLLDRLGDRTPPAAGAGMEETLAALRSGDGKRIRVHNDFAEAAQRAHPGMAGLLAALLKNGALTAFLAGSGSAVLGLAANRAAARMIAEKAARECKAWARAVPLRPLRMRISAI